MVMMMMKSKQEILDKARRHIAEFNKGLAAAQVAPMEDPVRRWAREGRAAEERERRAREQRQREEQRERRAGNAQRQEAEAIATLRAEVAELRAAIGRGDTAVLDCIASSILPIFDKIADRLDQTSAKVDRKLGELEAYVRASVGATAKFFGDASTPPAGRREIN
jgi:hypothetical protein